MINAAAVHIYIFFVFYLYRINKFLQRILYKKKKSSVFFYLNLIISNISLWTVTLGLTLGAEKTPLAEGYQHHYAKYQMGRVFTPNVDFRRTVIG